MILYTYKCITFFLKHIKQYVCCCLSETLMRYFFPFPVIISHQSVAYRVYIHLKIRRNWGGIIERRYHKNNLPGAYLETKLIMYYKWFFSFWCSRSGFLPATLDRQPGFKSKLSACITLDHQTLFYITNLHTGFTWVHSEIFQGGKPFPWEIFKIAKVLLGTPYHGVE